MYIYHITSYHTHRIPTYHIPTYRIFQPTPLTPGPPLSSTSAITSQNQVQNVVLALHSQAEPFIGFGNAEFLKTNVT